MEEVVAIVEVVVFEVELSRPFTVESSWMSLSKDKLPSLFIGSLENCRAFFLSLRFPLFLATFPAFAQCISDAVDRMHKKEHNFIARDFLPRNLSSELAKKLISQFGVVIHVDK